MRLALALLLVGSLAAQDRLHVVAGAPFRVRAPADWVVVAPTTGTALIVESPTIPGDAGERATERARIAVTSAPLQPGEDGDAFAKRCLADLASLTPGFATVGEPNAVHLLGRRWWRARYRFSTGLLAWEQTLLTIAAGRVGWCVTAGTGREHVERWAHVLGEPVAPQQDDDAGR